MKTRACLFLLGILYISSVSGQNNSWYGKAKLSANLQQFIIAGQNLKNPSLVVNAINGRNYLSALIKVKNDVNEAGFEALQIAVGTKAGNIWTVLIPADKLEEFINLEGMEYIQLDEPIVPAMDAARKATRADSVQNGIALDMGYSGKNTVLGIIDVGFDYTHPTFYDTTGTKLRIKRVWEQKIEGTHPAGFLYGNEITDTSAIILKGTEISTEMHGTHVAGIAAGSGFGSEGNKKYRGMAYQSDIVFVGIRPEKSEWKTSGLTSILDGMKYIYDYAASVGKPAVVNLSWGCSIGPNDGSSLFSQAVDNLTGGGKIFVLAAGNNGEELIHLGKTFSNSDSLLSTFVNFDALLGSKRTWVDIWGEKGKPFCINLGLYKGSVAGNSSGYICLDDKTGSFFLIGSNNDTCFITISRISSDFNQKPHVLLDIYSKSGDNLALTLRAKEGQVHLWKGYVESYRGYYGSFSNNGLSWASNGDAKYTLGEMACTKSAITVAAFASKNAYTNLAGSKINYISYVTTNQIVPFSSQGPTADLRRKPDIAAPGFTLGSAANSFDKTYAVGGTSYGSCVAKFTNPHNKRDYYYAEASGTSMATPCVSGIVALMLQANPNLHPQDIKNILTLTALKDNFTKAKPDSTRWGAGKINAYQALKKAIIKANIKAVKSSPLKFALFPNPNSGLFNLEIESSGNQTLKIEISNALGQVIYHEIKPVFRGLNSIEIHLEDGMKGMYFAKIGNEVVKIIME